MNFPRLQKRIVMVSECGYGRWCINPLGGRELLDVNPVFQPANLALRNAWFSGGVEWNIGIYGHSTFTCSPLFAARVERLDGTPILRMYEWERIRQVTACQQPGNLLYYNCYH